MGREFRPGEVISYPYLWAWQQERGETEGRKQRPVCVVIAIRNAADGNTHILLLAITTQPPQAGRIALEIPDIERRRAGLDDLSRAGSSLTNIITILLSAPGILNLIRSSLAVSANPL